VTATITGSRHGIHVAMAVRDRHDLGWGPPNHRFDRIRVSKHTCWCRATSYELCHAGGLSFIRRTHRLDGRVVVHDTPPVLAREAEELWTLLLAGEAR
jgi:hypothetical protein